MKNLLDESDRTELLERAGRLSADSERRWGTMDVVQMLCHVTDPMRIALGDLEVEDASNLLTKTVLRWLVLSGMPPPKGKIQTFPELDYAKGGGTPVAGFEADLETLHKTTARFVEHAASGAAFVPSPGFGRLPPRAYGRLMYVHTDHHLKQFGV